MSPHTLQPSDYWLSIAEATLRSGQRSKYIIKLIHSGQVMAIKRYGQWRINAHSLRDHLNGSVRPPSSRDVWHRQLKSFDPAPITEA